MLPHSLVTCPLMGPEKNLGVCLRFCVEMGPGIVALCRPLQRLGRISIEETP